MTNHKKLFNFMVFMYCTSSLYVLKKYHMITEEGVMHIVAIIAFLLLIFIMYRRYKVVSCSKLYNKERL
jgi:hypothetical protein